MPEGRNSDNKRPSHRPQFHYFYGSVGTGGGGLGGRVGVVNGSSGNVSNVSLDDVSDADKDSLVGESLVSTDNEGASEEGDSIEGLLGPYNDDDHNDDDDYRYNDDLTGKNEYNRLLRSAATNGTNGHGSGVGSSSNISRNSRGSNKISVLCCRSIWGVVISLAVVSLVTGVAIILFVPHNSDSSMSSSLSSLSSSSSSSLGSSESSGSSGSGTVLSSSSFPTQPLIIPFPKVDRSDYGDPVQNFIDTTLFHPDLLNKNEGGDSSNKYSFNKKSDQSSTSSTTFRFPFPTGAFWTNLIVDSPQGDGTSYPIAVYPYAYRWSQSSLQVSYPAAHRMATQRTISDTFAPDLSIEILEKVANRYVTAFDPLSVTLRYVTSPKSQFETALVQGSPYITLQYVSQTPIFRPLSIFEAVSCPGDSDENFSDIDMLDQDVTSSSSSMSPLYTSSSSGFENRNRRTRRRRTSSSFTDDERSATKRAQDQTRRTNDEQSAQKTRRLFGVCSIDDSSDSQLTTMRGVQFIFHTQEGARWIVFSSEPMNLLFDKVRKTTISSAVQFTGTIRLAYIPADKTLGASTIDNNASDNDNTKTFGSSTGLRRLIYHADAYPIGGEVSYEFKSTTSSSSANLSSLSSSKISSIDQSSRHATVTFSYKTRSMIGSSSSPSSPTSTSNLLMLALPHHADVMSSSVTRLSRKKFDLTYQCIKGNMTAIVGSSWSYNEPLYDLSFDGPVQTVDDDVRDLILQQVSDDLDRVLPTFSENIYGYGKQVARIAQLAHIADKFEPKVTTSAVDSSDNSTTLASNDDTSVLGKAKNILSKYLESFLSSKVSDALIFDSNMGGLVSTNGLHDKGEDFGNGRYNDHLFHYGYVCQITYGRKNAIGSFVSLPGCQCMY
jgi:endoglucanase Acf2